MIDLNRRLENSVTKVRYYGTWLTYGGLLVIIASIFTFIVEFIRMANIMRIPNIKTGSSSMEQLEAEMIKLEQEEKD